MPPSRASPPPRRRSRRFARRSPTSEAGGSALCSAARTRPSSSAAILPPAGSSCAASRLPLPAAWRFDTLSGLEEIANRRIARNELAARASLRAYLDAQRDDAAREGDEVLEFAQRIAGTPGRQDGLFRKVRPGEEPSPLGPFLAAAGPIAVEQKAHEPFFGYRFDL